MPPPLSLTSLANLLARYGATEGAGPGSGPGAGSVVRGSPGDPRRGRLPPPAPPAATPPANSLRRAKRNLSDLGLTTQLNHVTRAEKLLKALGSKDVGDLFRRRAEVVGFVERAGAYTSSSRMSFYSSLCALLNPEKPHAADVEAAAGAGAAARARRQFLERNAYWNRRVSEKQARLTRSAKKTGGALPFKTIVRAYKARRGELELQDRLLADMYLAAPNCPEGAVRRANYGACWVFDAEPRPGSLPDRTNYVVVPKPRRAPVTMVLNAYKTARSHGEYRARLPPRLASRVRESLEERPRPLLFCSETDDGFEGIAPNAFAKRVTSVMRRITGQPLGVNQLRRSYSSYVIDKGLPEDELRLFARGMNSSVGVMRKVYQRRSLMK